MRGSGRIRTAQITRQTCLLASSLSDEAVFDDVQGTPDWFLDEVDGSIDK